MAKEGDGGDPKHRLVDVDLHPVVLQTGEYLLKVLLVRLCVRTGDEEVVNVREAEGETSQDFVNEALEGLSGVPQTKKAS